LNPIRCRFWWRDTRLAELPRSLPPSNSAGPSPVTFPHATTSTIPSLSDSLATPSYNPYQFPYPISFVPIPYHTNTALPFLSSHIIPMARLPRLLSVDVPITSLPNEPTPTMDIDNSLPPPPMLTSMSVEVKSDGLLLYVSQASYEPGTSPLSSWIPITGYTDDQSLVNQGASHRPLDLFER
jgi:snurportin-1